MITCVLMSLQMWLEEAVAFSLGKPLLHKAVEGKQYSRMCVRISVEIHCCERGKYTTLSGKKLEETVTNS